MIQPSTSEIPSTRQLKDLPLRALVALAARVGRRVEPWARPGDRSFIDEALDIAERFARGDREAAASAAQVATIVGSRASKAYREGHDLAEAEFDSAGAFRASAAATAAAYIAHAVHIAADSSDGEVPRAVHAAVRVASYIDRRIGAAAIADFERVREQDLGQFPDVGEVIEPGEGGPFGPLWPVAVS